MKYKIVYSDRKTLAIAIKDGEVIVRAPKGYPKSKIEKAVTDKESWINKHLPASQRKADAFSSLSKDEISALKMSAERYFNEECARYASIMSAHYDKITITSRKKVYGTCTSKRELTFSYILMLFPKAAREYVVVHELAHLWEMNHSKRFYDIVARYMPDYKKRNELLKKGAILPEFQ